MTLFMKPNKYIKILRDLGLNENEAKVYFASLSLGPATILRIADTAELKRTTVYSIVSSLQKKGIMNIEIRGFKRLFVAQNPEQLASIFAARQESFRRLLPEFAALYNLKGEEGSLKYYQGIEAVKSVYESMIRDIRPHEDYLVTSDQQQWQELDEKFFLHFLERRAKLNINIRLLLQDSPIARSHQKIQRNYNETIKILPKSTSLTTNLVVIPRRVLIHQLTPPITGIVIENPNVVRMHQELFEIIWRSISD